MYSSQVALLNGYLACKNIPCILTHRCWFRQEDLFRILKAYSVHNTTDGYCQAQAPIAAVLLMHMPAEQAFWCLVSICEKYLPGYYSAGLVSLFTELYSDELSYKYTNVVIVDSETDEIMDFDFADLLSSHHKSVGFMQWQCPSVCLFVSLSVSWNVCCC